MHHLRDRVCPPRHGRECLLGLGHHGDAVAVVPLCEPRAVWRLCHNPLASLAVRSSLGGTELTLVVVKHLMPGVGALLTNVGAWRRQKQDNSWSQGGNLFTSSNLLAACVLFVCERASRARLSTWLFCEDSRAYALPTQIASARRFAHRHTALFFPLALPNAISPSGYTRKTETRVKESREQRGGLRGWGGARRA